MLFASAFAQRTVLPLQGNAIPMSMASEPMWRGFEALQTSSCSVQYMMQASALAAMQDVLSYKHLLRDSLAGAKFSEPRSCELCQSALQENGPLLKTLTLKGVWLACKLRASACIHGITKGST